MMREPDEMTPAEREEMARLPRHREPGRLLEARTIHALRERGLLRPAALHRGWWAAAAAAAVALFATGFAVGQRSASLDFANRLFEGQRQDMQAAAQVQRTGSAWVAALAALAEVADSTDGGALEQGREAARAALLAAASEFAALAPGDAVAGQILWLLSDVTEAETPAPATRTVFWF